eukprot:TRINITY_DN6066_c0_g1_i1.p1 TRINITY_DN6066_c0_g1~~TRINITY_DN6066_c0_g1_i1.p1  ORF type:complete len:293 (+),score=93.56 TRINITY_DN6066_c0_g1_i1:25-879(+)
MMFLGRDVVLEICGFLGPGPLLRLSETSAALRDICTTDALWVALLAQRLRPHYRAQLMGAEAGPSDPLDAFRTHAALPAPVFTWGMGPGGEAYRFDPGWSYGGPLEPYVTIGGRPALPGWFSAVSSQRDTALQDRTLSLWLWLQHVTGDQRILWSEHGVDHLALTVHDGGQVTVSDVGDEEVDGPPVGHIAPARWTHVALVFRRRDPRLEVYLDGDAAAAIVDPPWLGSANFCVRKGFVSEVMLWARALGPAAVHSLAAHGPPIPAAAAVCGDAAAGRRHKRRR